MKSQPERKKTAEIKPAQKKPVILVVEPDNDLRSLLSATFRLQNFRVYAAASAREGEEIYRPISKLVDIVLLNGNTVGVEGIGLIIAIRRANPHQKIILISEFDNPQVSAMRVQGLVVVIMRPLTVDKVVDEVLKLAGLTR